MFMSAGKLMGAGGAAGLGVADVFSVYPYSGNTSTQNIVNGIDLSGLGGFVWCKSREPNARTHRLFDTARGATNLLISSSDAAEAAASADVTAFNADGFSLGSNNDINGTGETYVAWSFAKAEKFFDIVTWVGDSNNGREIEHSLGVQPGMIIVKDRSSATNWIVWHLGTTSGYYLLLNTTAAEDSGGMNTRFGNGTSYVAPSDTILTIGNNSIINSVGDNYVAYLFAHDTSADGVIQCGSFTTDGSGNATVTGLPGAPQYVLIKASSTTGNWIILDTARGWASGNDKSLLANTIDAEVTTTDYGAPTSDGFTAAALSASQTYIYMAIRAP